MLAKQYIVAIQAQNIKTVPQPNEVYGNSDGDANKQSKASCTDKTEYN